MTFRDLFRRLAAFRHAVRGAAAVEFAIVAPIALVLYIGAAEVSDGIMASRSLSGLTRTIVDIVSQQSTSAQATSTPTPANAITATTLSNLLTGATSLMYPRPTSSLTMTLSAVDVTNTSSGTCCKALVRWSFTQGGTLRPCVTQLTGGTGSNLSPTQLPAGLLPTGTTLAQPIAYLIADTSYTYQPVFGGSLLHFAPTMVRTEYMMPRSTGQVITGSLPASGAQYGKVCY